jgi:outer membrane immunogenic protein
MRKASLIYTCVVSFVLGVSSALAADIGVMPTKAPAYVPYNWTGLYVGINGGGGWGRSNFSAPFATGNFNVSGGLVGGTLGYNWQINPWVWGLEGDIDWSNIRGSTPCLGTSCDTRNSWLGTFRGRVGYAWDRWLPYFTGGLAVGDIRTSITGVGSANTTRAGWTIGGGLEGQFFLPRWTAKIEYLYVDLGRGGSILGSDASFHAHLLRGGLNYRF